MERAGQVIADRYDDPVQRDQIAEAVGIGALKYGDLSVARESSYTFDFDRMLALTGNTGPYLQYATARIRSIFRKAGLDPARRGRARSRSTESAERALALTLLGFRPGRAAVGAATAEPHHLAGFLFDVGQRVHHVLRGVPVGRVGGQGQVRDRRPPLAGPAGSSCARWCRIAGGLPHRARAQPSPHLADLEGPLAAAHFPPLPRPPAPAA